MNSNKKENSGILVVCLVIIVLLICLVGIFDFMIYGEIKKEKENLVFTHTNTENISNPVQPIENNKTLTISNNQLCINDNCNTELSLGAYNIKYEDNKVYINNNVLNTESSVVSISLIDDADYSNYLLIKLSSDEGNINTIYNSTTNTLNNIN